MDTGLDNIRKQGLRVVHRPPPASLLPPPRDYSDVDAEASRRKAAERLAARERKRKAAAARKREAEEEARREAEALSERRRVEAKAWREEQRRVMRSGSGRASSRGSDSDASVSVLHASAPAGGSSDAASCGGVNAAVPAAVPRHGQGTAGATASASRPPPTPQPSRRIAAAAAAAAVADKAPAAAGNTVAPTPGGGGGTVPKLSTSRARTAASSVRHKTPADAGAGATNPGESSSSAHSGATARVSPRAGRARNTPRARTSSGQRSGRARGHAITPSPLKPPRYAPPHPRTTPRSTVLAPLCALTHCPFPPRVHACVCSRKVNAEEEARKAAQRVAAAARLADKRAVVSDEAKRRSERLAQREAALSTQTQRRAEIYAANAIFRAWGRVQMDQFDEQMRKEFRAPEAKAERDRLAAAARKAELLAAYHAAHPVAVEGHAARPQVQVRSKASKRRAKTTVGGKKPGAAAGASGQATGTRPATAAGGSPQRSGDDSAGAHQSGAPAAGAVEGARPAFAAV